MALTEERLREITAELARKPRHEKVRANVYGLLVDGLDARSEDIDFEQPVKQVHGRIDALLGRTVFEFKSDLQRERGDAEEELTRYLSDFARRNEPAIGVATDGAQFAVYEFRRGALHSLGSYETKPSDPHGLLLWLSGAVAVSVDVEPTPEKVTAQLGRGSAVWLRARSALAEMWESVGAHPDVALKRQLWAERLALVYGSAVDEDDLFFQHTYLTAVAKTIAGRVVGVTATDDPEDLLHGRAFEAAGVRGAVEADFFDWPLQATGGWDLIKRIALEAARFRLEDVKADVLKGLYESLIDPGTRHDLGEYYTPDWLAARMCERAIDRPLEQRVLDPACGSGTFLFHAARRLLTAADAAKMRNADALRLCAEKVLGIDIHPVAVQIARVTYLLALGEQRLTAADRPEITIPVYLGDSMQWNTEGFMAERLVRIRVPDTTEAFEFPEVVARDPNLFDTVITHMLQLSEQGADADQFEAWLTRAHSLDAGNRTTLRQTYALLRFLEQAGRNHIWGFVARNQVRPVWLSQPEQRADVVIGNPPWLSYRYMSREMQDKYRDECQRLGLWTGQVAQQHDLSSYFFARCVEIYLKVGGLIAFVMPYAAMSRRAYAGFRTGIFGRRARAARRRSARSDEPQVYAAVIFGEAWALTDRVQKVFEVPSCVLFAQNVPDVRHLPLDIGRLPPIVQSAIGEIPRNADLATAQPRLKWHEEPWPEERVGRATGSQYAERFRAGAVIFPTVLFRVELGPAGRLGRNPKAPLVQSRRSRLEKSPWSTAETLRGNVEAQFLRALYVGESVAPFRILQPILAVIPYDEQAGALLNAARASESGFPGLTRWLAKAEALLAKHGKGKRTLIDHLDYYGQLTAQFPVPPLRVIYAASGTLPAAAVQRDARGVNEHKLYWAPVETEEEGLYLVSILNSEHARGRVAHLQSRGQWGTRDFDKVLWTLPIPKFDAKSRLHRRLAKTGMRAEEVAAAVPLKDGMHFVKARQIIRKALQEDGVAGEVEQLVQELLG